jgi:hypothetical protein
MILAEGNDVAVYPLLRHEFGINFESTMKEQRVSTKKREVPNEYQTHCFILRLPG